MLSLSINFNSFFFKSFILIFCTVTTNFLKAMEQAQVVADTVKLTEEAQAAAQTSQEHVQSAQEQIDAPLTEQSASSNANYIIALRTQIDTLNAKLKSREEAVKALETQINVSAEEIMKAKTELENAKEFIKQLQANFQTLLSVIAAKQNAQEPPTPPQARGHLGLPARIWGLFIFICTGLSTSSFLLGRSICKACVSAVPQIAGPVGAAAAAGSAAAIVTPLAQRTIELSGHALGHSLRHLAKAAVKGGVVALTVTYKHP